MTSLSIDAGRLINRIKSLGEIGRDENGRLIRLAASDNDRLGRDQFVAWLTEAGLSVAVDRIGNIFGIWSAESVLDNKPIMLGSHIDTVIDAGIYDGCYGVLSGLEVI
jgi:beta-ureidopropionase / N-carbamoyl-L-amino-acid hydrolase